MVHPILTTGMLALKSIDVGVIAQKTQSIVSCHRVVRLGYGLFPCMGCREGLEFRIGCYLYHLLHSGEALVALGRR
jgi:hypothetical protein